MISYGGDKLRYRIVTMRIGDQPPTRKGYLVDAFDPRIATACLFFYAVVQHLCNGPNLARQTLTHTDSCLPILVQKSEEVALIFIFLYKIV